MEHYIPHSFIQHAHSPVLNVALYIPIAPQLVTTVHLVVKQQPWMSAGEGSTVPQARTNQNPPDYICPLGVHCPNGSPALPLMPQWQLRQLHRGIGMPHLPRGVLLHPCDSSQRLCECPAMPPLDTTALLVSLWVGWASWHTALNQIDESWLLAVNSFWRPVVFWKCIPCYSESYFLVILMHKNELWVCAQRRALT